jgi:arylformamidase
MRRSIQKCVQWSETNVPITAKTKIHDITISFSADVPVWPGDPPIEMRPLARIAEGATANVTQIVCPSHCGTHVDPPWHFVDDGPRLDGLPIERWVGPCQVIRIPDEVDRIEPADLEAASIAPDTNRLLFKTRNSARWSRSPLTFETDYVALTPDAARWVIARGIKLIGIDALSFELFDDIENVTHRTLLGNDVVAIEGLDLSAVEPGFYDLVCLPLKLRDGDGAPARVILLEHDAS